MAAVEDLLAQLRAAVASQGAAWVRDQVDVATGAVAAPDLVRARRPRRSRPPARLSPEATPRARRRLQSPSGVPPASTTVSRSRAGRHLRPRRGSTEGGGPGPCLPATPSPSSVLLDGAPTAPPPGDVPTGGAASQLVGEDAAGGRMAGLRRRPRSVVLQGPGGQHGAGPAASRHAVARRRDDAAEDGGARNVLPVERGASRRRCCSCSCGRRPVDLSDVEDGELLESRRDQAEPAGGFTAPVQPGECLSPSLPFPAVFMSQASGGGLASVPDGGGVGDAGSSSPGSGLAGNSVSVLVGCLRDLIGKLSGAPSPASASSSPLAAWVGPSPAAPPLAAPRGGGDTLGVRNEAVAVSVQTEPPGEVDRVRLDDRARGEIYVCFEVPLGAHLKKEVKERIWKDEYVEIFSLLPLEKFNLDKGKRDESKKDEEEKRRYRLIPQTFVNWLQAFAILASVIGEKGPEHCSALFCYMDAVGEAHRVYGGQAWLRYDEQFRQRKAVRPSIRWDHKDIALWLKVTAPVRAGQSFPGSGGSASRADGSGKGTDPKLGLCWQFNDSLCKFGAACKYKHTCSACGGASHGASKCLRKGRRGGGAGASMGKGGDSGDGGKDGAVSK